MKNTKMAAAMLIAGVMMAMVSGNVLADNEDLVGIVTENGYENEYFGVKCELPSDYTIDCRSSIQPVDPQDNITQSNSDATIQMLANSAILGDATVFSATAPNEVDNMVITVATPGVGYDTWDSEEAVAFGTIDSVKENLEELNADDLAVENIEVDVTQVDFLGEKHSGLEYNCTMNGTPVYGKGVILISEDSKFAFFLETVALDQSTISDMFDYFTIL